MTVSASKENRCDIYSIEQLGEIFSDCIDKFQKKVIEKAFLFNDCSQSRISIAVDYDDKYDIDVLSLISLESRIEKASHLSINLVPVNSSNKEEGKAAFNRFPIIYTK